MKFLSLCPSPFRQCSLPRLLFQLDFEHGQKPVFSEVKLLIVNSSSSICLEAFFKKGYLAKSSKEMPIPFAISVIILFRFLAPRRRLTFPLLSVGNQFLQAYQWRIQVLQCLMLLMLL